MEVLFLVLFYYHLVFKIFRLFTEFLSYKISQYTCFSNTAIPRNANFKS